MRHRNMLTAGLLLTCVATASLAQGTDCPVLADAPTLDCVASPQGWFYAASPDAAKQMAEDAALAAQSFITYFGRPAPRGALIAAGAGQAISDADRHTLTTAGAVWQLPWLDADGRRALQRSAVERQLRARMPDLDEAQLQARIDAALPASAAAAPDNAVDRSSLRHEIGHMLLIRSFWPVPETAAATSAHYGGPGPDWLDELAAVLMESDTMSDARREKLHAPEASTHLKPLAAFFAMPHPMVARMAELTAHGPGAHLISGQDAKRLAGDATWFYVQARGVADFLLAPGDDPAVFGSIAAFLADGGDMDGWLAAHGAQYGLPASIAALGAAWTQWLAAPAPSPAPETDAAQAR